MLDATFILYVSDLDRSTRFYAQLLQRSPVPFEPTFVMFFLESGARLGLVARETVEDSPAMTSQGFELDFPVGDNADVDRLHDEWAGLGAVIVRPPHDMPFAYNFLAADPDGHRLRVFCRRVAGS
ncbi:VOC family protein [Xylophilus sp. GOD-11R]|uniref:VOC family protein n=1 Tax=Xylophilus sp. GOD-11R TaxID=3089814 RepID=UPI00298CADDA|nr:VOC family protein [Xylophilus sp. GOD-11R]WPB58421.1 VOC family protein [Xylophilus sp. GOD-11R]